MGKRKIRTENEKTLIKSISVAVSIILILIGIVYAIFLIRPDLLSKGNALITIGSIIFLNLLLFWFKTDWVLRNLVRLTSKFRNNELTGRWQISIEYLGSDNNIVQRIGTLRIENSYNGLYIRGESLYDKQTNIMEVQNWESSYADIFMYERKKILFYQYITYEDGDPDNPTKTGIVNVKRKNKGVFTGVFRDFEVDTGKEVRSGNVSLFRAT